MVERKTKECNIEINQISGTVKWINTKTNVSVKEMEFINPKSDEWFMKHCPTIPDITDSAYIYSLSGWDIVKNSINIIEFHTKWTSTPRYLWYKYNCNETTKYKWNKYNYDPKAVNTVYYNAQGQTPHNIVIQYEAGTGYTVNGPCTYTHDDGTSETGYEFVISGITNKRIDIPLSGGDQGPYYCHSEPKGYSTTSGVFRIDVNSRSPYNPNYKDKQLLKEMYGIVCNAYTARVYKYTLGKQGTYVSSIQSTNSSAYPDNGVSGNYWYTKTGTTMEYSRGEYIISLRTTSITSFTNNARNSDGYWYVLQS